MRRMRSRSNLNHLVMPIPTLRLKVSIFFLILIDTTVGNGVSSAHAAVLSVGNSSVDIFSEK